MTRWGALALAGIAALGGGKDAAAEPPSRGALDRVSPAVLQVAARDCGGARDATGTGFLWGAGDQVVTALHLIAGCQRLSVYSEKLRRAVGATPSHVLVAADLALLHLEEALPVPPAELAVEQPALHEDLAVLGYSLGAPSMGDRVVRLAFGASRLNDLVSAEVAGELRDNGSPSLDLDVLRLDGVQVPGNSGAPIVNRDGRVVGVGDGGLEQGISSITWAVPARQVPRLAESADALPQNALRTRQSFAAELESAPGESLQCGTLTFRKLRTRPFARLRETTDDPLALQQVLGFAGAAGRIVADLSYDIWVHEDSGGAIAVPAGSAPAREGFLCAVHDGASFTLHFGGVRVASVLEAQMRSLQFEQHVQQLHGNQVWQRDPQWSYAAPHINGLEGVVIQRTSGYGLDMALGRPTAYGTETLMARGDTLIGVALVVDNYDANVVNACRMMPQTEGCDMVEQGLEMWLRSALGVLLSTFSAH